MDGSLRLTLLELLYTALREPIGLRVPTNDASRLRAKLYEVRKEQEAFRVLSFTLSPASPETELWITRNEQAEVETPLPSPSSGNVGND